MLLWKRNYTTHAADIIPSTVIFFVNLEDKLCRTVY